MLGFGGGMPRKGQPQESGPLLDRQVLNWQIDQDPAWADRLIEAYRPFILKSVSDLSGRYIDLANDDEYSIGLQAFYEAMQRFDERGGHFLGFARLVIASRLKSYWQKENRTVCLPLEENDLMADDVDRLSDELSMADNIASLSRQLLVYGLDFVMLARNSPKHRDTRVAALEIARALSQRPDLMALIERKQKLPVQQVARELGVSAKVIKHSKFYILAAALIFGDPESEVAAWLEGIRGGDS
jgi:RNA polymerase sigma factor